METGRKASDAGMRKDEAMRQADRLGPGASHAGGGAGPSIGAGMGGSSGGADTGRGNAGSDSGGRSRRPRDSRRGHWRRRERQRG